MYTRREQWRDFREAVVAWSLFFAASCIIGLLLFDVPECYKENLSFREFAQRARFACNAWIGISIVVIIWNLCLMAYNTLRELKQKAHKLAV